MHCHSVDSRTPLRVVKQYSFLDTSQCVLPECHSSIRIFTLWLNQKGQVDLMGEGPVRVLRKPDRMYGTQKTDQRYEV